MRTVPALHGLSVDALRVHRCPGKPRHSSGKCTVSPPNVGTRGQLVAASFWRTFHTWCIHGRWRPRTGGLPGAYTTWTQSWRICHMWSRRTPVLWYALTRGLPGYYGTWTCGRRPRRRGALRRRCGGDDVLAAGQPCGNSYHTPTMKIHTHVHSKSRRVTVQQYNTIRLRPGKQHCTNYSKINGLKQHWIASMRCWVLTETWR